MLAIGAGGAIRGIKAVVDAASDLEESTSKAATVFGDSFDRVADAAEDSARATGLAQQEYLEAAGTLGNLFTAQGIAADEAARLSTSIVQLGADIASFNNLEVDEALTALRSGLVGETEPLRRVGIVLNAAAVEAKALELGLVDANGEVSEAAKVQARYALITEQAATQTGDFARTSGGLANQQRILAAELKDAAATVGAEVLPAVLDLVDAGRELIPVVTTLAGPVLRGLGEALSFVADVAGGVGEAMGAVADAFGFGDDADDATGALNRLQTTLSDLSAGNVDLSVVGDQIDADLTRAVEEAAGNIEGLGRLTSDTFGVIRDVIATPLGLSAFIDDTDKVVEAMGDVDRALAGLIATDRQVGADALQETVRQLRDAGVEVETIAEVFPQADAALRSANQAARTAAGGAEDLADGLGEVEEEAEDATSALDDYLGALDDIIGVQLDAESASLSFLDSLDDLTAAVKESKGSFDPLNETSREARQAFIDAAEAAISLAKAEAEAGASVDEVSANLSRNIDQLRAQARAAGATDAEVAALVQTLGLFPDEIAVRLTADASVLVREFKLASDEVDRLRNKGFQVGDPSRPGVGGLLAADGMIVDRPTPVIAGEAGAEVIIPLTDPARARELVAASGLVDVLAKGATPAGPTSPGTSVSTTINVGEVRPNDFDGFTSEMERRARLATMRSGVTV